jgi:UDP-GlcNAc:undecaprenyl-phosphate GlcNAc-1-phosphate transferase
MRLIALKVGLVDVPNSRKIHESAVPLVGGLVLYFMAVVMLLLNQAVDTFTFYLMLASGLLLIVGLLDDLYQLSALWRFVAQICACLIVIFFTGLRIEHFGELLAEQWVLDLGWMSVPVTVFGVVGVINALNMVDGIDGLAAMTFFLPTLALAFLTDELNIHLWLVLFLFCILIFVVFNKSKNYKVFLGDNGSLFLGFVLAWLLVYFSQGYNDFAPVIEPVTALYLVALPVYDTIFVMLKRMIRGHSPFKPDRTHLHHLFLALGLSQTSALLAMIVSQALLIVLGVGFLFVGMPEYYQFYLFVFMSVAYYFGVQKMWKKINSRSV